MGNSKSKRKPILAIDTETTGLSFRRGARPFYVSTCTSDGTTRCWRTEVDPFTREVNWGYKDKEEIREYIGRYYPIFHNAKFDIEALKSIGISVNWQDGYEDTLLASHAVSSSGTHKLKELGVKYLKYSDYDEVQLKKQVTRARNAAAKLGWNLAYKPATKTQKKKGIPQMDYWVPAQIFPDDTTLEAYATNDVERTMLLWLAFEQILREDDLWDGYAAEKELQLVVNKTEQVGITVDLGRIDPNIAYVSKERNRELGKATGLVERLFNRKINIDSPDDLCWALHDKKAFNLPVVKLTEKGNISSDKDALKILLQQSDIDSYEYKFVKHVLTSKAYTSGMRYMKSYKTSGFNIREGWVSLYPSLNQLGAKTNRFSSSNPNGQNIGKKKKYMIGDDEIIVPKSRDNFCPLPENVWYAIDYSQIEVRVFATISGEQSILDALDAGYDFHGYVASKIFNKPIDEISDQERTIAKNVNFALLFGASPRKVDATAGMVGAYDLFAGQFPNAAEFMQTTIEAVKKTGYISTVDGYRLDVPLRQPYKSVNYKVQGTAGRIIKKSMCLIAKEDWFNWKDVKMMLQVHDELLFEIKKESKYNSPEYIQRLGVLMEEAGLSMGISTPVSVERIDDSWGNGKEINIENNKFVEV